MVNSPRPFTLPDPFAASTDPATWAPSGIAVTPDTTTGFDTVAFTGSSALLVSDATLVSILTVMEVPSGMVTSTSFGAGGAAGVAGAVAAPPGAAAFDEADGTPFGFSG